MPGTHPQGLVKKRTLTGAEVAEIERLIAVCDAYEGLHMRLGLDELRKRSGDEARDLLYYEDGALVGYLGVDGWGKEREMTGMVHPGYRRRGIFSRLFAAAKAEYQRLGVHKLILVCEQSTASGQAFVKTTGAQREYAEHEMVLGTFKERRIFHEGLQMRQADSGDLDAIASILAADSGNVEAEKQWIGKLLEDPSRRFYLATLHGKPLGCLRLDDMGDQVGIYAFEIRMGYRGLGYGRQMLEEAIRITRAETQKRIMLDVETNNTNAIGLYRSCGFEVKTTYDYYALEISL
ncbi:MAG TPA: GNAT family N-acetyltransferase [Ktedonobacteraceae bacterium]|nr:GNAT family N-acetyltransferase [Ktedonobacteraceae bacterium]